MGGYRPNVQGRQMTKGGWLRWRGLGELKEEPWRGQRLDVGDGAREPGAGSREQGAGSREIEQHQTRAHLLKHLNCSGRFAQGGAHRVACLSQSS